MVGDEKRFKQVMINLLKNALKFTSKGRIDIKVGYNEDDQLLVVHVRDTGMGIDRESLPKLFSKFGRLYRTANQNNDGIGLGLTMVKQIILKNGGTIMARSKGLGQGSTFIFSMRMEMVRYAAASQIIQPSELMQTKYSGGANSAIPFTFS